MDKIHSNLEKTHIQTIWEDIENVKSTNQNIIYRRYSRTSRVDFYIGVTFEHKQRFIAIPVENGSDILANINKTYKELSFNVLLAEHYDGSDLFLIALNNQNKAELFTVICNDLINHVETMPENHKPIRVILERIESWEKLFSEFKLEALSFIEQIGLFGELCFIKKMIDFGICPEKCLKGWNCDHDRAQDFDFSSLFVEIKTKTHTASPSIKISSEYQLDGSNHKTIYINNIIVKKADVGLSLPEIIDYLKNIITESNMRPSLFEIKLAQRGYIHSDRASYENNKYIIVEDMYYYVDDDFPKIVRSELSQSIIDVTYSIKLPLGEKWIVSEKDLFLTIIGGNDGTN